MITTRDVYQLRTDMLRTTGEWKDKDPLSKGHKGALIGHLNKAMGGDLRRQLALSFLFSWEEGDSPLEPMSTHNLSEGQWHAIRMWVDAWNEPEKDEWLPAERFVQEAKILADYAEHYYYSENVVELDPMFDDYPETVKDAMKLGGEIVEESDELHSSRFMRFKKGRK